MALATIRRPFPIVAMRPFKPVLMLTAVIIFVLMISTPASAAQVQASANHPLCTPTNSPIACLWYVKATQTSFPAAPVGIQGWLTVERPVVQGQVFGQEHSLAAMYIGTVQNDEIVNGVELGWAVAPNIYTDEEPHLFAFSVKDGVQTTNCWQNPQTCGWYPLPSAKHHLAEYLPPAYGSGVEKPFMILHNTDGNWWIQYDQEWIGYFKGSYWNGKFTSGNILSWYGEVETMHHPNGDCTAMGDGRFGTQSGAAHVGGMGYRMGTQYTFSWASASENLRYGDEKFYNMGSHAATFTSFYYGGPGGYVDEHGNETPCST